MKTLSITLCRRPKYTKILLEHLSQCFNIDQYSIFIYCEPVNEEVINLAKNFRQDLTTVIINPIKFGCNKNILQALDNGLSINDFHIHLEDDTIPGKDFLIYCEWCRNHYANNLDVFSVSGYANSNNKTDQFIEKNDRHEGVATRNWFTPWGWATWRDRWNIVRNHLFTYQDTKHISWDVVLHNLIRDKKECFPIIARVQNIGAEDGEYCPGPEWHKINQYNEYWIESIKTYPTSYKEFNI